MDLQSRKQNDRVEVHKGLSKRASTLDFVLRYIDILEGSCLDKKICVMSLMETKG